MKRLAMTLLLGAVVALAWRVCQLIRLTMRQEEELGRVWESIRLVDPQLTQALRHVHQQDTEGVIYR